MYNVYLLLTIIITFVIISYSYYCDVYYYKSLNPHVAALTELPRYIILYYVLLYYSMPYYLILFYVIFYDMPILYDMI